MKKIELTNPENLKYAFKDLIGINEEIAVDERQLEEGLKEFTFFGVMVNLRRFEVKRLKPFFAIMICIPVLNFLLMAFFVIQFLLTDTSSVKFDLALPILIFLIATIYIPFRAQQSFFANIAVAVMNIIAPFFRIFIYKLVYGTASLLKADPEALTKERFNLDKLVDSTYNSFSFSVPPFLKKIINYALDEIPFIDLLLQVKPIILAGDLKKAALHLSDLFYNNIREFLDSRGSFNWTWKPIVGNILSAIGLYFFDKISVLIKLI